MSYRDLEEMVTGRGVPVDHSTIYRWVQNYGPELGKQTRWYRQESDWQASSRRVDQTYIRVGENGATSIGRSPPVARPWTSTSPPNPDAVIVSRVFETA